MHIVILSNKENYVCFLSASVCPSLFKWKIVKVVLTQRFFSPKITINRELTRNKSWDLLNILLMRYSKWGVRYSVLGCTMIFWFFPQNFEVFFIFTISSMLNLKRFLEIFCGFFCDFSGGVRRFFWVANPSILNAMFWSF